MTPLADIMTRIVADMEVDTRVTYYTASGSSSEINGDYYEKSNIELVIGGNNIGPYDGWMHETNEAYIYYERVTEEWVLVYFLTEDEIYYYTNDEESETPPLMGWVRIVGGAGAPEPPTLTSTTTGSVTTAPSFHYGHPEEIVNTFSEMVNDPDSKSDMFPAVCMMMDFEEEYGYDYQSISSPTFIILTDTKPEYKAADRYEQTFDAILYPLYERFLAAIDRSTEVESSLEHTKIDRVYWGKNGLYGNTANIFNDFVDAMEINKLELKIIKTC